MAKSKYDDLSAQLDRQTEGVVVAKAGAEKELNAAITVNLNQLKAFIDEGSASGADLKILIDAMASVSGKTLAQEKIDGPEGKTVKNALDELLEVEKEYNQGRRILAANAKKLNIDLEAYLANTENPLLQQVVTIKDEAERIATEIRIGIKAYAVSLVDHLQTNNTQKSTKTDEELARWKITFSPAEFVETGTHENQMASIVAKFVEEQAVLSEMEIAIRIPELRMSKKASKEVIWGNYAAAARKAVEERFPHKEDEDRCRDFLRKLLDTHNKPFAIDTHTGDTMIIVNKELGDDFTGEILQPIVLEYVRARLLSTVQLDRSSLTLDDTMRILGIARSKEMTHQSMIAEVAKFAGHPSRNLTKDITEQVATLEIAFLNQLDATVQFLFKSIPEYTQKQLSNGNGDYRLFSPIWNGDNETVTYPKNFVPRLSIQATTAGTLYSPLNTVDGVSDGKATENKEAFTQQLSDALSKGQLREDQKPFTTKDHVIATNLGTVVAEQRALAAETAKKEAEDGMQALAAKLAASELALQAVKDARSAEKTAADSRDASSTTTIIKLQTEKGTLTTNIAALEITSIESKKREAALIAKLKKWSEYGGKVQALIVDTISAASKAFLGGVSLKTFKGYIETHIPEKNPDQE